MGVWKNEDDIKAELRTLTADLRQLREELRSMVSRPKLTPGRGILSRQAWSEPPHRPAPEPIAEAADKSREHPPKRRKK